ncbi:MAG: extradiol ring-cleavage dioxygenase [Betaproteobacteria bacterium]|nr:extradiol ring-cleavage dioxygenase [Betaproteobacteria bacterium]
MTGVFAAITAPHVPTLSRAEITPDFQRTLVDAERQLGETLRARKPDLWVIASTHWVSTFNWFATCQPNHQGICVADEAPDLVPGLAYRYRGDPEFAGALVETWNASSIPAVRNDSPHYSWDYGTFVPLSHLDPKAEVAVVGVPTVLMANLDECHRAGAAIHATARALGRRAVFVASTALSHALVRGRHHMPTPERVALDQRFINLMTAGRVSEVIEWLPQFSRDSVAEMGGRVLATMLGCLDAMQHEGGGVACEMIGGYAQSSGSGNVSLCATVAGGSA